MIICFIERNGNKWYNINNTYKYLVKEIFQNGKSWMKVNFIMKNRFKIIKNIIIGLICLCSISYLFTHYDGREYENKYVNDYIERMCEIGDIPGISIAVLDDEEEYYINQGYANKKAKIELNNDTKFELGSTTKAFTALGILLLEQDNKLNRNDSVNKYLPWFLPTYKGKAVDVTIEHLLCHTSGVPSWTISNIPIGTINDSELLEETVKTIQAINLESLPGTAHNYATINYDVLALIIETVTGIKYEQYIEQNILYPLEMTNSYFRVDDSKLNNLAQGYRYKLLGARKYDAPTFYGNTAAGYLISNIKDLMIWMKAQIGIYDIEITETIEKLKSAIIESHSYPIEKGQNYFAGWNLYDTYFCHGGNNPNFSSQVIIDSTDKKAVFALANISGPATTKTVDGVYRILHGEKVKIGFFMDGNSLIDLFSIIFFLIELYIAIILFEKRNWRRNSTFVKAIISLIMAFIIIALPYILHYNYLTLSIWFSPCFIFEIVGSAICFILYFIGYMYNRKHIKRKF